MDTKTIVGIIVAILVIIGALMILGGQGQGEKKIDIVGST
ncbi:MAG: Phosphate-binding protein PstS, partial [Methanobacteriaceae archaeon 41_258]